jgi:diacylglycerol kinase family enzyme
MKYVLYNPLASNKNGEEKAHRITEHTQNPYYAFVDITTLSKEELDSIIEDAEEIVLAGGDGTLNSFVNLLDNNIPDKTIYFYPIGSGNDFVRDVREEDKEGSLIKLNKYIKDLPKIEINGKSHRFINGAGYGVDGFSCAMVEKKTKEDASKKCSYVLEAFLGIMYAYKPGKAKITVDGVTTEYENVWMISAMNGRYFGGGVKIAPNQDRLNSERTVSVVIASTKSRLKILRAFPSIKKGTHLRFTDLVTVIEGKEIYVEAENPSAVQIDGDPITDVTKYKVTTEK